MKNLKSYLRLMNKLEPSQLNPKLGRGLKCLREHKGWTLDVVAKKKKKKFKCCRNTVFNIENGTYKRYVKTGMLLKMLTVLEWDSSLIEFLDLCDLKPSS